MLGKRLLAVAATASVALGAAALPASASPRGFAASVSYTSDQGDYVGQGGHATFVDGTAQGVVTTVTLAGSTRGLTVLVSQQRGAEIDFAIAGAFIYPAQGQKLRQGVTYKATRAPFNTTTAGLDFDTDHRGCNELDGTFTVKTLKADKHDRIQKLDVVFEQHCEHALPALHGEIKYAKL